MINLPLHVRNHPQEYKQLHCGDALFTMFNCLLKRKHEDIWSKHNYIVYVVEGRKIWHTNTQSYDLTQGTCVFVRKGAHIVEQFFETDVCFFLFFVPDEFICEVLKSKQSPIHSEKEISDLIIPIENGKQVQSFFQSMIPYFDSPHAPDTALLELKFKELILTIADNPHNEELLSYFCSLLHKPKQLSLQQVMENNFSYNLKLEEYASLSARSLSAFKRDFEKAYQTSPGKWLLERRLHYAHQLLSKGGKTVAEAAFESGFESTSHFSRVFKARYQHTPASLLQKTERAN